MLLDYLRSKKILLVIDNCEHLIGACAQIVENLLRACPDLRVLATSRERLGIGGETAWRVPSLSLPDFGSRPPIESLRQYEAVRLFIDRATSAVPGFMVTDQNAPEVAQICHRLDGIPLAIELAAARVKALSVEQIVERLDDRLRLLTGGSRTALPRHQTLRATMDWSYELLNEAEKVLLRRLSAFAGGWTLPAAEVVCTDGIHRSEVVDLLTHLVDKSLVVVEERGKEVRYKLLEMVRQYGREKLIEAEEESILSRRHREWYLGLAERAEPELWGRDQVMWLDQLEAEHDNLRAALGWSLESGEIEVGLQLAGALWRFWFIRGYLSEGRRRLEKALSHSSVASASVRAKALTGAGGLAWRQGDYRRAEALLEEGLTLFRELGYKRGIALSLRLLGHIALDQSDYERATVLGAESLALRRELGHKGDVARSLSFLGVVALRQCDYDLARALIEECLDLLRELGIKGNIAWSLKDLGLIARNQKDHSRAAVLLEESLDLFRGLGDKQGISQCLEVLGGVAVAQGQQERAAVLYKESLALCRELGDKWNIAQCLEGLARVAETEGQSERAAQLFSAAEALREALDTPLPPSDHTEYDRSVAAVCAGLGEETFRLAWEEGRKMALEQAIEYALSD
jgi:predicted ATPase